MLWPYAILLASVAYMFVVAAEIDRKFGFASMCAGTLATLYLPISGLVAIETDGMAIHWLHASATGFIACIVLALISAFLTHRRNTLI